MLMIQNVICQIISDKIDSKFCINKTKILDFVKSIFGLFGTKMFKRFVKDPRKNFFDH